MHQPRFMVYERTSKKKVNPRSRPQFTGTIEYFTIEYWVVAHLSKFGSPIPLLNLEHFSTLASQLHSLLNSCDSTGSRVPILPGTLPDPTGYYYCTLQLGCRIVVAIYSVHLEVKLASSIDTCN